MSSMPPHKRALGARGIQRLRQIAKNNPEQAEKAKKEAAKEMYYHFQNGMRKNDKKIVEAFIASLKMQLQVKPDPQELITFTGVSSVQEGVFDQLSRAFMKAVKAGFTDQIKTFIEAAPSLGFNPLDLINCDKSGSGSTALHLFTIRGDKDFVKYLIEKGANPNIVNAFQRTPLLIACHQKNPDIAKLLIAAGADPNYRYPVSKNATIFSWFISTITHYDQGTKRLLEILFSGKPDINAQDVDGRTALFIAVGGTALIEVLEWLLKKPGINVNHQDKDGATALTFGILAKSLEKMKLLLKAGANPNLGNISTVPLFVSVDLEFEQGSKLLLETGKIDVDRKLERGNTLLIHIALCEQFETMKQLFEIYPNVQVNCKNENQRTALGMALSKDHLASVEFLLTKKADPTLTFHSFNLLHSAAVHGSHKVLKYLLGIPALLKMINTPDAEGHPPLIYAVKAGHVACAKLLLEHGASLSDEVGTLPLLTIAAQKGNPALVALFVKDQPTCVYNALIEALKINDESSVKILLQSGHVNVNYRKFQKNVTLLHIAVDFCNNPTLIELLLQAGFDPNAVDDEGMTPLHAAVSKGFTDIIPVLLKAGANINAVEKRNNQTPLTFAAVINQVESVNILLQFKADLSIKTKVPGSTWAMFDNPFGSATEVTTSAEIVHLLRAAGCKDLPFSCYTQAMLMCAKATEENTYSHLIPILDWNEDIFCNRFALLKIKLYEFFNSLGKEKRATLLKLFLAERLKIENITKDSINFAVDVLVKTCSDFNFLKDYGLDLTFTQQKTNELISINISLQNFIDGLKQLKVEKEVADKQISAFSEILWSFSHKGQLGRIKDTFLSLQEKTLNTFNKTIELCQRDLTTIQQLEREYHQCSLESHHKDLQKDCQTLFSEVKALKEHFSSQDLKVTDFTKDLTKEYEELSKRFEKLNEFLKRYNEKITPSITQMKEKLAEQQEKKSNVPAGKAKTKKRGRKKHVEMSVSHGQNTTIASAPSKEKQEQTNSKSSEIQKDLEELQEVLVSAPKQPAVTFRQEPTKLAPEILAEIQKFATAFQPPSLKQSFTPARGPQPHTLAAKTQLPQHLKAVEGRGILQRTSQQALGSQENMTSVEWLIQATAMKGALAQALESRIKLDEGWPNEIRNLIFHHEKAFDECFKGELGELIATIQLFNKNLNSIKENVLIKGKAKLKLHEVDVDDFFSLLLKQKREDMSLDALQKEIARSEEELDSFKIYIQEKGLNALKNANLKMAVGFALARMGTCWNKLPQKLREKATCPYRDYIEFGNEYRHVDEKWGPKVSSFIKRCLADASSAVKPKEVARAPVSSSAGAFGGGFGLETKVRHEQYGQHQQYGQYEQYGQHGQYEQYGQHGQYEQYGQHGQYEMKYLHEIRRLETMGIMGQQGMAQDIATAAPLTFYFDQGYGQPLPFMPSMPFLPSMPFTQPAMPSFVAGPRVLDIASDAGDRKKAS